jgi:hypothetical protein
MQPGFMRDLLRTTLPAVAERQAELMHEALTNPDVDLYDDGDEEEEVADEPAAEAEPAPLPNGEMSADGRPRATRPSANGGAGRAEPDATRPTSPPNGRSTRRTGARSPVDPPDRS